MDKKAETVYLGIEFGSTRIKSVLIGQDGTVAAVGSYTWENRLVDGYWTYGREDAIRGMRESYADLKRDHERRTGKKMPVPDGIGISGMMHGYIPTDEQGEWLVNFRTWRNTTAAKAASLLSDAFGRYMPPRWSVSHLYQAVIDGEEHLPKIKHLFTLAAYIHWILTGKNVVGLCEGSGMFPVRDGAYRDDLMAVFRKLCEGSRLSADPASLFPTLLPAGAFAGSLTKEGALLLDPSGDLPAGIPFCPPEGDAATGMVCTDSVAPGTANVSAGTSAFLMAVLPPENEDAAKDLDCVTTPDGLPVAMIHEINCTGDINRWERLFAEVADLTGGSADDLFTKLFRASEKADADLGGLVDYPFFAAEPAVGVKEGTLALLGMAEGDLTLPNLMKALLASATAPLAHGVRKLYEKGVTLDRVSGHGGFFKTPVVGAKIMSAALKAPIVTFETAGEGGAYGMALLSLYSARKAQSGITLPAFLQEINENSKRTVTEASAEEQNIYNAYLSRYLSRLPCPQNGGLSELKRRVFLQNLALKSNGLVTLTWGNVSAIDRERGLVVIKPSGVPYEEMTEDDMVVVDLDGNVAEGKYRPSSDTPTHLYLYRAFPELGGIVHTHSTYATAFAQAGRGIPCYGTTHADAFFGEVPVTCELTEEEIGGAYEYNTGKVIAETYKDRDSSALPAVLVRHHGVFTFGKTPEKAVENAVTVEEVAKMAEITESLTASPETAPSYLQNKHYFRKHGKNAYYGQKNN